MPIFRINDQLHYFAHVPKCGGTSVEAYLVQRFGEMALKEPIRKGLPDSARWTKTLPQHITVAELDLIIPRGWIVSSFATVRHPLRRLISAFFFWRDAAQRIPLGTDFNAWCAEALPRMAREPFRYDGHLQPQSAFVPPGARFFRLEDGLDGIPAYLDGLTGSSAGPAEMPVHLVGKWRAEEPAPQATEATLALVAATYAEDFARFGYPVPTSVAGANALPDLPNLAQTGKPPEPTRRSFAARLQRSLLKRAGL